MNFDFRNVNQILLTNFWVVPGSPFFPNFTGIYQRDEKEEVEEEGSEQGIRATVPITFALMYLP